MFFISNASSNLIWRKKHGVVMEFGERFLLRFAPSTENGLPLIWARPRFCEDTFSRLNKEETEKVAGERCMRGEIFPSE